MRCSQCGLQQIPASICKACGADLKAASGAASNEPPSQATSQVPSTWLVVVIVGLLTIGGYWLGFSSGARHAPAPTTPPATTASAPSAPAVAPSTATAVPAPGLPTPTAGPVLADDPQVRSRRDASEAIQALQDLLSAIQAGLSYTEYSRRLVDTKIKVDRYLQATSNLSTDIPDKAKNAMDLFEYARDIWAANIRYRTGSGGFDKSGPAQRAVIDLMKRPALRTCGLAMELLDSVRDDDSKLFAGVLSLPPTLWGCASRTIHSI